MIYLDSAATTRIEDEVLEEMMPFLKDEYGNAGTSYSIGRTARDAIDKARGQVANLFGTKNISNIMFVSGGSEGNNFILKGFAFGSLPVGSIEPMNIRIITSAVEHDSVINSSWALYSRLSNVELYVIKPKPMCGLTAEDLKEFEKDQEISLDDKNYNTLVYIMHTNNETGIVNDVHGIGKYIRSINRHNQIWFGCDCVQAAGVSKLNVENDGIDFAVISSHKIGGPKGVGAVYAREKEMLEPLVDGGSDQEYGFRGGTENVAGIVGLGKACELAVSRMRDRRRNVIHAQNEFIKTLDCCCGKDVRYRINKQRDSEHYSKVLSITVDGVDSEALVMLMDLKGVCIAAGSACRTSEVEPSKTLIAYGFSESDAYKTVRISFSWNTTVEEAREAAEIMAQCILVLTNDNTGDLDGTIET